MAPKEKKQQDMEDENPKEEEMKDDDGDSGSEGSSDDSDDSDDDEELPEEQLNKLMEAEQELEANPNLYDKHVEVCSGALLAKACPSGEETALHAVHPDCA